MKLHPLCIAMLFAAGTQAAHAAEFNGPITFDKPQYLKGETAVASIKGKGQCKNIEIDWGDGQKNSLGDFGFGQQGNNTLKANHQYNIAGNFNVQVKTTGGSGKCDGINSPVAVLAPGQLTGIVVDKTNVTEGDTVMLTLNGNGVCATNTLLTAKNTQAGGGFTGYSFNPLMEKTASWPRYVAVKLANAGKYEFKVSQYTGDGQPPVADGCHGFGKGAQPVVTVAKPSTGGIAIGSAQQLGQVVGGQVQDPCPKPEITLGLGAFKSGNSVAVGGCKFGTALGQAWLRGLDKGDVQLIVDTWGDKGVGVKIPAIDGTPEKEVTLDLVLANGQHATKKVVFKPEIVTVLLKKGDFPSVDCSANNALVKDTCVSGSQTYQSSNCGFTICAQHKIPSGIVIPTPVTASDSFTMTLKHGWKFEKAKLGLTNSGADFNGLHTMPVGPQPAGNDSSGGTSVNYKVGYKLLGSGSWVEYKLDIYVTGPKGVPFH